MPDIEGVPYETTGTPLDQASAQALAARNREAISAGVAAGNEAKALAQSVVADVRSIRTSVEQSAVHASAAAGSAAQAQQTATDLVPRVEHIETIAGLAPGEVTDAQTANLITQPDTATRDALNAATAQGLATASELRRSVEAGNLPILQSTKVSLAALQNKVQTRAIRVHRLVTGGPEQTASTYAGQTVSQGSIEGVQGWRAERTTGALCRLNFAGLTEAPGPVNAVTAWVYITDPTLTTSATLIITGPTGTWSRTSNQSGSATETKPLVQGWQLLRFDALSTATYLSLHNVTNVDIRFNTTAPTSNWVGPVDAEVRPKGTVIIVNDWGSKPFLDNGYPALKARGYPVVWAPRVERMGQGTYPDNHVSLAEFQTLLTENGNEISFHSPDGSPTSALTPAQARQNVLDALVGLKIRDLYTDGALWRAAWVQNVAPGAHAANDLLVCSATPNDRYHNTPWPPLNRHDIPRNGIKPTAPGQVAQLKDTRGLGVFYTHGVIPEGTANHSSQAEFDAFVAAVDTGVSEGWLEVIGMGALLAREPLVRDLTTPVKIVNA